MHDIYSLSNKVNYSLQFTMYVFELVWISVQQPSYKITANFLNANLLLVCVQIFSVNVLSTFGTPCLMMSVSTLFIGLDVLICLTY